MLLEIDVARIGGKRKFRSSIILRFGAGRTMHLTSLGIMNVLWANFRRLGDTLGHISLVADIVEVES